MVSTGKEGVIYNGLSDWLYEGEPRGLGRGGGRGLWALLLLGQGWWWFPLTPAAS